MPNHTYSLETLYHFRCYSCLQWFTVGDCPEEILAAVSCPKCRARGKAVQG